MLTAIDAPAANEATPAPVSSDGSCFTEEQSTPTTKPPPNAADSAADFRGLKNKESKPKRQNFTIEPPAKWLASLATRNVPFTEKTLKDLGRGAWLDVFMLLLRDPQNVERAFFSVEYWEDQGLSGTSEVTRLQWLVELGEVLKLHPPGELLNNYLTHKYGAEYFEVSFGKSVSSQLNELRFAASFLIECYVEFDNASKVFRRYDPATGVWKTISDEWCRKLLMEYAVPSIKDNPALYPARNSFFKNIYDHCRPLGLPDEDEDFGAYTIIGVKNGAIALKTCSDSIDGRKVDEKVHFAKCSPSHRVKNVIPVEYLPDHKYPAKFIKFLLGMMSPEDVRMLQLWCGMVLLGRNYYHRILIISGQAKRGKSTLINLIEKMIGSDNTATLNSDRLEDRFELSEYFGKTLLIGKDVSPDFLSKKSAHMLKSLSGDMGIKAEVKFAQQRVRLAGPFNIVMVSNSDLLVDVHGDAAAWDRRLLLIEIVPTNVSTETIPDYEDKLIRDEGPAILYWMLQGAQEILKMRRLRMDFKRPDSQSAAIAKLLGRSNPVEEFVRKSLAAGNTADGATSEELYVAYENFCARSEIDPLPSTYFLKRVGRPIFKIHKGQSVVFKADGPRNAKRGYARIKILDETRNEALPLPSDVGEAKPDIRENGKTAAEYFSPAGGDIMPGTVSVS